MQRIHNRWWKCYIFIIVHRQWFGTYNYHIQVYDDDFDIPHGDESGALNILINAPNIFIQVDKNDPYIKSHSQPTSFSNATRIYSLRYDLIEFDVIISNICIQSPINQIIDCQFDRSLQTVTPQPIGGEINEPFNVHYYFFKHTYRGIFTTDDDKYTYTTIDSYG